MRNGDGPQVSAPQPLAVTLNFFGNEATQEDQFRMLEQMQLAAESGRFLLVKKSANPALEGRAYRLGKKFKVGFSPRDDKADVVVPIPGIEDTSILGPLGCMRGSMRDYRRMDLSLYHNEGGLVVALNPERCGTQLFHELPREVSSVYVKGAALPFENRIDIDPLSTIRIGDSTEMIYVNRK